MEEGSGRRRDKRRSKEDYTGCRNNHSQHGIIARELHEKVPAQVDPRFRIGLVNPVIGGFVGGAGNEKTSFMTARKGDLGGERPRLIKRWRIAGNLTLFPVALAV